MSHSPLVVAANRAVRIAERGEDWTWSVRDAAKTYGVDVAEAEAIAQVFLGYGVNEVGMFSMGVLVGAALERSRDGCQWDPTK